MQHRSNEKTNKNARRNLNELKADDMGSRRNQDKT